ncbi:MAG: BrnA antitoxin family protein [Tagaea sp.]
MIKPTRKEDAAIAAAIAGDPDAAPDLARRPRGLVARGRPKLEAPKRAISLRVDADVVARFKASGRGWQSRMNAALRKAAGL